MRNWVQRRGCDSVAPYLQQSDPKPPQSHSKTRRQYPERDTIPVDPAGHIHSEHADDYSGRYGRTRRCTAGLRNPVLPELKQGKNRTCRKNKVTVSKLRARMPDAENKRQKRSQRCNDKHLRNPRCKVIVQNLWNHFFVRFSFTSFFSRSSLRISSSCSPSTSIFSTR